MKRKFQCTQTQEMIAHLKDKYDVKYAEGNLKDSITHSTQHFTDISFVFLHTNNF